jgi:outer membrane immunogenic protein
MKRLLMAGALALAAGSAAFAADLPPPVAPPRAPATYVPAVAPAYNWSGFYLGINGGYGFGNSDWTGGVASSGNFNTSGFVVGGTAGANYQMGQFVLGAETDLDFSTIKGTGPATFCANCQTTNNWLGTARARVGFALDRVLFYGTGGAAYGNIDASANGVLNSSTQIGWTAGAGIEGAFADNWTAKIEYLYADLGHGSCTTACGSPPFATQSVSLKENLVRLGVNYKFGY